MVPLFYVVKCIVVQFELFEFRSNHWLELYELFKIT